MYQKYTLNADVKFNNRANIEHKLADGKTVWQSRSMCVAHIIIADAQGEKGVVIVERSKHAETAPGQFSLPCGYVDYDETLEEAVVRETYEETNMLIKNPQFIGFSCDTHDNVQNITALYASHILMDHTYPIRNIKDVDTEMCEFVPFSRLSTDLAFNHSERIRKYLEPITFSERLSKAISAFSLHSTFKASFNAAFEAFVNPTRFINE